jgi:hypothetical protein
MATITMKRPEKHEAEDVLSVDQRRPALERFRLEIDRQVKVSFASFEEAEKAGRAIKKAYPVVQVSVYDAEEHRQQILE